MTTENENKPAFYIFVKDENGENKRVGAAFVHNKGNGMNLVIDGKRYTAFQPKPKPDATPKPGM